MDKRVATPKQTAGGGFIFEDKVVGYVLVRMLSGSSPFPANGAIERVDCQVSADGWIGFDDLLITCKKGDTLSRYALSIKSNIQFSKDAAPPELVQSAWELLLHRSSGVMNIEYDFIGLICVPHPNPPKVAIQSLIRKSRSQTPSQLAERLKVSGYASEQERNIHASCICPENAAIGLSEENKLPGHILRKMIALEYDFEDADSTDEAQAIFLCTQLVESGDIADASTLWAGICQIAQRIRQHGGLARSDLIKEARKIAQLRDLPDYARDWEKIHAWKNIELDRIRDQVTGGIKVARDTVLNQVFDSLESSRFVSIVGTSGTGKSVIAKQVAQANETKGNVLWLKGERVRHGYVEQLANHYQLSHPLAEVLKSGKSEEGLIVLDGGERLLGESDFTEMCVLLNILSIQTKGSGWRLLVTCREEAWDRVQYGLIRAFGTAINWYPVRIQYPTYETLRPVWEAFPGIRKLAVRPHLSQLMRNFKVVDLLATASAAGQNLDGASWNGESQMINWYWKQVVRDGSNGPQRDILLQNLAVENADRGRFTKPETELSAGDLAIIPDSSHLVRTDDEKGTVSFVHDLIADWARFRAILAHENGFHAYCISRFKNPHWHTALRLYGVYLLEADMTGERWKAAILANPLIRDCLLEALVFAGNSQALINGVWSVLIADKGDLLRAFLKRFQHVASIPNPEYITLASHAGIEENEARIWERIPLWMYWLGILPALAGHKEDLITFAPTETAQLSRSWLRHTGKDWPGREYAAELAVAVAQQTLRTGMYSDKTARLHYTALLEAYSNNPENVRELLLKAAARIEPTVEDGELFRNYTPPGTVTELASILGGRKVTQEPWPHGPLYRADEAFRDACFNSDAMRGIMLDAPELAQEIVLALLIEFRPPKLDNDFDTWGSRLPEAKVCLYHDHSFKPRFYNKGPFLLFLRTNPQAALNTICHLINFATERWMEASYNEEYLNAGLDAVLPSGVKRFIGDPNVYNWYHGLSLSDITSSALMAVEKWLYECLDKEEDISHWIELLLSTGRSIAFLGMLCEVGKYTPILFTKVLQPLLLIPHIYYIETIYASQGASQFGTPISYLDGESFFDSAREWDGMKHRKKTLLGIACTLFHRDPQIKKIISSERKRWQEIAEQEADDEGFSHQVQVLIATFDLCNWREIELPDGSKAFTFEEPEHLRPSPEDQKQREQNLLQLTLPITCRKMIEEGSHLKDQDIPEFIEKSKNLVAHQSDDQEVTDISPVTNSLLGTAAVLFVYHRAWLRSNPNEEAWCIEVLDQALATPLDNLEISTPMSLKSHDGELFAAEIATIIWSESPMDERAMMRIFYLVLAHDSCAGVMLRRAFERRKEIGDGFWQLTNLMIELAAIRWEIHDAQYKDEKPDFSNRIRKAKEQFLTGKFSTAMPDWGERSLRDGKPWSANNHPRYYGEEKLYLRIKIPKIDRQQIKSAFDGIFLPIQAADNSERERFYKFWDQTLIVSVAATHFYDDKGEMITESLTESGLTDDFVNWALEQLALVVGQMRSDEKPDRFWKPILELGCHAEHWVDNFLSHWFIHTKKTIKPECFMHEWKKMVDFCLESNAWNRQGWRFQTDQADLWMALIGLPRFVTTLWQEEDAAIIEEASEYFIKVSDRVLTSPHHAVHFLNWLTRASAKGVRKQLLGRIAKVGLDSSDYWWQEEHLASMMARYLALIWHEHAAALDADSELKNMFLSLVHQTAATQEPLAMELQSRIAAPS